MQKRHFGQAAKMVKAILDGEWTSDLPAWALFPLKDPLDRGFNIVNIEIDSDYGNVPSNFVRAVWTAEAFVILFRQWNPLFDETRFLIACGLVDAPAKRKRAR